MTEPPIRPSTSRRADWWHLAIVLLVAPFYIGLYVITAVGALLSARKGA